MSDYINRFHDFFQKFDLHQTDPNKKQTKFKTPIKKFDRYACGANHKPIKYLHNKAPNPKTQEWNNRREAAIKAGVPKQIAYFIFDIHARNKDLIKNFKIKTGLKSGDLIGPLASVITKIINKRVKEFDMYNLQKRISENDIQWLAETVDQDHLSNCVVISVINRLGANAYPTMDNVLQMVRQLKETSFLPIIPNDDDGMDRAIRMFHVNLEKKTIKMPTDLKESLGVLKLCRNKELVNKWFAKIAVKLDIPINIRNENRELIINPIFQNIIDQFVGEEPIKDGFKLIGY